MEQLLECLRQKTAGIANTTAYFMNLAEEYLVKGDTDSARACLILLCENCDNYEESLEWNGLTKNWQRHRHLVEGLVSPSLQTVRAQPLPPDKCTMQISEIFALPKDALLSALSLHLRELSAQGDALNYLNKWERIAYYADELCMEVNSGGFDSYLYYHGTHFEKACQAIASLAAPGVAALLDAVRSKFPRNHIPKNLNALQNVMDGMAERGVDFESEDERFYTAGEKELLTQLMAFVQENKTRFR